MKNFLANRGETLKRVLLYLFLFGVLPLGVYGIYTQIQAARKLGPVIEATLTAPYAKAVKEGRIDEAYRSFTSASFQANHTLEEFTKAQAENTKSHGKLLEIRTHRAFQAGGNLFSGERYYQGGLIYRYTNSEVLVVWQLGQQGQEFRIDAMFEDRDETLVPGIY